MTDVNQRRKNKRPVNQRYKPEEYNNGFVPETGKQRPIGRIGKTDFLDKSMHSWSGVAPISGLRFQAGIRNDFTNGHRGMARSVKGAKKFVRTRVRFHENAETKRLSEQARIFPDGEPHDD